MHAASMYLVIYVTASRPFQFLPFYQFRNWCCKALFWNRVADCSSCLLMTYVSSYTTVDFADAEKHTTHFITLVAWIDDFTYCTRHAMLNGRSDYRNGFYRIIWPFSWLDINRGVCSRGEQWAWLWLVRSSVKLCSCSCNCVRCSREMFVKSTRLALYAQSCPYCNNNSYDYENLGLVVLVILICKAIVLYCAWRNYQPLFSFCGWMLCT